MVAARVKTQTVERRFKENSGKFEMWRMFICLITVDAYEADNAFPSNIRAAHT